VDPKETEIAFVSTRGVSYITGANRTRVFNFYFFRNFRRTRIWVNVTREREWGRGREVCEKRGMDEH